MTPIANATKLTTAVGTAGANGDNELIAATISKAIVIVSAILQNESSSAVTMTLYSGASSGSAPLLRVLGQNQGDGVAFVYPEMERPKTSVSASLVLNLSGAHACGYSIGYYLE